MPRIASAIHHALGELAAALGETGDADLFHARGKSWANVYDEARHYFYGRRRDGSFDEVDPASTNKDFAEGTPWHYDFMVPRDPEGLASPVLFSAFVFSAVGDLERTGRWTRWTLAKHFGDGPDGLPGNDDGGTMSAFYLFAAMGLYPVAGTDRFVLGSPLFPKTVLALPGGELTIEAPGASRKRRFPREVLVSGVRASTTVTQAQLANATLRFALEREPSAAARLPVD